MIPLIRGRGTHVVMGGYPTMRGADENDCVSDMAGGPFDIEPGVASGRVVGGDGFEPPALSV